MRDPSAVAVGRDQRLRVTGLPRLLERGDRAGAIADLARAEFVLANSARVGVPERWLPGLAFLKGAGAAGLLVGLLGMTAIGIAAAAGLVLFHTGAVAAHLRARVFYNIAFPGAFLALAVASLAMMLAW